LTEKQGMEYGVGIVGTGLIADMQAKAITDASGVRLVSVLSRSKGKAAAFAEKNGCAAYSDEKAFLRDPALDIVSICTPPGFHREPALHAIEAGKHVMVEKPLEITLRGCDAIIEAAARKGVKAGCIFQSRYHEAARVIKRALEEGRFGRLTLGEASVKWFRSQAYYDEGGWKSRKSFEAGALMNQAIHAIDLLQWYMGPVRRVHAFAGALGHERLEVEDTAVAALHFANGSCGVIQATTAAFPGFKKRVEICGTSGSAVLEEEDLKFWQFDPPRSEDEDIRLACGSRTRTGGGAADPAAIGMHGHLAQFEEFASAVREDGPLTVDAAEARKSVAIILAAYESARTGKPVSLKV
jgi:UDP-N-acetyl-2-amino-2-deoxyglucuronate dehydrogenase